MGKALFVAMFSDGQRLWPSEKVKLFKTDGEWGCSQRLRIWTNESGKETGILNHEPFIIKLLNVSFVFLIVIMGMGACRY